MHPGVVEFVHQHGQIPNPAGELVEPVDEQQVVPARSCRRQRLHQVRPVQLLRG